MIKKGIISLFFLFLSSFIFSQQISNGNFETWTDEYNADGWNSVNELGLIHTANRSTDAHLGVYATKLESKNVFGNDIPGFITLGQIDTENHTVSGGVPFAFRPTGMSYFFKFLPQANDTSVMFAILTKWNNSTQSQDTIGATVYFTSDTYSSYTELNVPFFYRSAETPDTLNITFLSSSKTITEGSSLYIDDVTCLYGAVISPTITFAASDITYNNFTTRCIKIPTASSYSLDVSENKEFISFVSGYENLNLIDTFKVVDTPFPSLYFYRVRVNYGAETSINSNTIAVPMPINNLDATDIMTNSFTANWQQAINATNYYIDIATDENFLNFVTGYENVSVGNTTSVSVSGVDVETEYFYRIRVEYEGGNYFSKNSNVISVSTASTVNNILSDNVFVYSSNKKVYINSRYLEPNRIDIYNIQAKHILSIPTPGKENVFNLQKTGLYIVKIQYDNFILNKKVIVK